MANTSGAIPQPLNEKVKAGWQEICMAATRQEAIVAFDLLVKTRGMTYQRAVKTLTKDRDLVLTFYDFLAKHCKHTQTTNPIESVAPLCTIGRTKPKTG